jgi:hypothetical protein
MVCKWLRCFNCWFKIAKRLIVKIVVSNHYKMQLDEVKAPHLLSFRAKTGLLRRAMAEKKVSGQRSYRVATRLQSFRRPNMISMRLRRLYFRLSDLTVFFRDARPGMQSFIPLSFMASRSQSAL